MIPTFQQYQMITNNIKYLVNDILDITYKLIIGEDNLEKQLETEKLKKELNANLELLQNIEKLRPYDFNFMKYYNKLDWKRATIIFNFVPEVDKQYIKSGVVSDYKHIENTLQDLNIFDSEELSDNLKNIQNSLDNILNIIDRSDVTYRNFVRDIDELELSEAYRNKHNQLAKVCEVILNNSEKAEENNATFLKQFKLQLSYFKDSASAIDDLKRMACLTENSIHY